MDIPLLNRERFKDSHWLRYISTCSTWTDIWTKDCSHFSDSEVVTQHLPFYRPASVNVWALSPVMRCKNEWKLLQNGCYVRKYCLKTANVGVCVCCVPSQERPWDVTPDRLSLQTLQKVGRACEQAYQLCIPEKCSTLNCAVWQRRG